MKPVAVVGTNAERPATREPERDAVAGPDQTGRYSAAESDTPPARKAPRGASARTQE